ncbi:hypothetical protein [Streptomyces sp. MP131-18]|uniref:hypothetical protein n=1 Tax=Streptomyces sp. MP131-18 TaxID=1857892 RepID=UPI00097C3871|nr:hypothetical protein [Streptomyces sp. MP131-18]ONK12739.1 hypothetical protein STBA_34910 [Streptomyces sp. MP131-18]
MNWENNTCEWIPTAGCALLKTGLWFDAIRVPGTAGDRVAFLLAADCAGEPGPVVGELIGPRRLSFLLPPRSAPRYDWPPIAESHGRYAEDVATFIGIPALAGYTWPLFWFARPTAERPFVDPALLHGKLQTEANAHAPS